MLPQITFYFYRKLLVLNALYQREGCLHIRLRMEGLEPSRFYPTDFKSVVSANSTTSALWKSCTVTLREFLTVLQTVLLLQEYTGLLKVLLKIFYNCFHLFKTYFNTFLNHFKAFKNCIFIFSVGFFKSNKFTNFFIPLITIC